MLLLFGVAGVDAVAVVVVMAVVVFSAEFEATLLLLVQLF